MGKFLENRNTKSKSLAGRTKRMNPQNAQATGTRTGSRPSFGFRISAGSCRTPVAGKARAHSPSPHPSPGGEGALQTTLRHSKRPKYAAALLMVPPLLGERAGVRGNGRVPCQRPEFCNCLPKSDLRKHAEAGRAKKRVCKRPDCSGVAEVSAALRPSATAFNPLTACWAKG